MRDFSVKPKKKRDDVKEYILLILLLSFAITLAASGKGAEFALGGIKLWAAAILPALFPYFFISAALGKLLDKAEQKVPVVQENLQGEVVEHPFDAEEAAK